MIYEDIVLGRNPRCRPAPAARRGAGRRRPGNMGQLKPALEARTIAHCAGVRRGARAYTMAKAINTDYLPLLKNLTILQEGK